VNETARTTHPPKYATFFYPIMKKWRTFQIAKISKQTNALAFVVISANGLSWGERWVISPKGGKTISSHHIWTFIPFLSLSVRKHFFLGGGLKTKCPFVIKWQGFVSFGADAQKGRKKTWSVLIKFDMWQCKYSNNK
jgi:hypothetical protein